MPVSFNGVSDESRSLFSDLLQSLPLSFVEFYFELGATLLQCAAEGETTLANLSAIVRQLKKERDRVQHRLSGLNAALAAFAGVYRGRTGTKPRRELSAKGRARIAAAQRARWARVKGRQNVIPIAKSGKRTMSASARRKIAAAQRKRWAKFRAKKAA
jgi:hypothetical protein